MFGRTRKVTPPFIRACKVYLSAEHGSALVAAMFNHAGLFAERPGEVSRCELGDPVELGRLARAALDGCQWQPEFNHRDRKKSDWPAFQQSGCRSMREFESAYDGLLVSGANETNITWEVASAGVGPFQVRAEGSVAAGVSDRELGECVIAVWETSRRLREQTHLTGAAGLSSAVSLADGASPKSSTPSRER